MATKNTSLAKAQQTEIMGFQQTEIDIIKNSVAKGTTDAELSYFLAVAKSTGLNPFQKEIWCYKSGNDMLIFAGRDGFLANAQKKNDFQGIRSAYVCENDHFKMNIPSGHIEHTFDGKERGKITGAYAIVKRANMDSFISYASMTEFNKGYNAWKSNPGSMIKKVAEAHALKQAYALNGVDSEHDYDFNRNTFSSDQPETVEEPITLHEEVIEVSPDVKDAIEKAETLEDLGTIFDSNTELQSVKEFTDLLGEKKKAIKAKPTA